MSAVNVVHEGNRSALTLSDVVDDTFDLDSHVPGLKNEIFVLCSNVKRINSTGVKKWIMFFQKMTAAGKKVYYVQLSPVLVEQFNLISNFGAGGTVVSIEIPFQCTACGKQSNIVKTKEELQGVRLEKAKWPCKNCGKPALEFDDIEEEYLKFWHR
jgi:hypothetical protein